MKAPTLIFGWGNPSRGDDALGPCFVEAMEALVERHPEWGPVDCLTDFQLQVEHALDLQGRRRVLFVDASLTASPPFTVETLAPARDGSFTSHAMSPQALLQVYCELEDEPPPEARLLAIRGEDFELGQPLSAMARQHLAAAMAWTAGWIEAAVPAPQKEMC
ncbi:hydrogenase maturation protease [Denitratisoma oestradiolicum]|uniref:Ni/Fe hydrogenase n=1 Tax=Denitratisoma oestradiolicum TaxID=311182 RepID=A0A6S6YNV4_9PROT|nr:hydrogenase maturation protease [Denitratisoma oestradiolicum]TWO78888.1 Ni/Fe hydrogenase [Denitratisoma oestradiolicum]CAB1369438.1 Ni/Fe hydrogenase [Denitratisoma oestradiolicum]